MKSLSNWIMRMGFTWKNRHESCPTPEDDLHLRFTRNHAPRPSPNANLQPDDLSQRPPSSQETLQQRNRREREERRSFRTTSKTSLLTLIPSKPTRKNLTDLRRGGRRSHHWRRSSNRFLRNKICLPRRQTTTKLHGRGGEANREERKEKWF